jgi:hypothetical protein
MDRARIHVGMKGPGQEEQTVSFALVISFLVIMCQELSGGAPQRGLAKKDQLGQALRFDGTH